MARWRNKYSPEPDGNPDGDLAYIAMTDQEFNAIAFLFNWHEHKRLAAVRDFWRNTWLEIRNLPTI